MTDKSEGSFLVDCLLITRDDQPVHGVDTNGNVFVRLKGYAIIPIEKYEKTGKELLSISLQLKSDVQKIRDLYQK